MDVSKQITLTTPLSAASSLHSEALKPVSLEQLALLPARTYEAQVITKASTEILQTLATNLNAASTPANTGQGTPSEPADSLWLLRVQGKVLLTELPTNARAGNTPNVAIHPGDTLWIQLRSDGSLAFRPAPPLSTPTPPSGLAGDLAPLLELAQARIEQHLARTLHQQQPLSSVLMQLSTRYQSATQPETQMLLRQVLDAVQTKMPSQDLFELLNSAATPALAKEHPALLSTLNAQIARSLQHYLDQQGLTFERSLFRSLTQGGTQSSFTTPPTPEAPMPGRASPAPDTAPDSRNASPLKTLLQRFNTAPTGTPTASTTAAGPAAPTVPASTPLPPGDATRQLQFDTARALATSLHPPAATPEMPSASSNLASHPLPAPDSPGAQLASVATHDLKGTLLGLIKTLSTGLQAEAPLTAKPASISTTQDNLLLLANPLAFPRPMPSASMLKANAMLAEEELSTGQILRLLAGMLHRIQFNQLNSLHQTASNSADNVTTQSWMFDLPIINNSPQQFDFFQVRLDREKHHAPPGEPEEKTRIQWKVSLAFHFDGLGQINIHLRLMPPSASSVIWATQSSTLELLKQHAEHLRERMALLGLSLHDIQYQEGAPANESRPIQASIVDTRA